MDGLAFHKYEGLGNDFVLIEADREDLVSPEVARALCDRRFGVGADGVLLVLPAASAGAAARMRVLNADGSIPEMCGNGLRCAALHVARARSAPPALVFETDAGPRSCRVVADEGVVTIDMGVVRVLGDARLEADGVPLDFTLADAGNPHAITFAPVTRVDIDRFGPRIATHARFPAGTNVEFARLSGGGVDLVVWERGVGVTHACGTGACATVAVCVDKGLVAPGVETRVTLPGGDLFVAVDAGGRAVMRGPARHVFTGRLDPAALPGVT